MSKQRNIEILTELASMAARRRDERSFFVGALGLRSDGAQVRAFNGSAQHKCQGTHAETRLSTKLDYGATVWVARQTRDGKLALAKPCPNCELILKNRGVKRIIFSTGPCSFESMNL